MADIPPIVIAPDEGDREIIRELIFEAEAAGKPERVYVAIREALYDAWAKIDALRAAQAQTQGPEEEGLT